jgi:hypothetical protein
MSDPLRPLKELALKLANAAGYDVARLRTTVPIARHVEAVAELEALYRHLVLRGLPPSTPERSKLIASLIGTKAGEAIHLIDALQRSSHLEGDVCEFGVAQGATSALLAHEIRSTAKKLWLFDSFEGLPKPGPQDVLIHDIFQLGSMEKYQGTMAYGEAHVLGRLNEVAFPLERANLVPGFIEQTIRRPDLPRAVCFAYVDFDFYEPIKTALEFLDGTVPAGGHVVVDDYGWFSAGAQAAVDEFVDARQDRWKMELPLPMAGHFAVLVRSPKAAPDRPC